MCDTGSQLLTKTGASTLATYGVFGEPGPTNAGRFGFTGQARLADTGLYHYKARVYAPVLGRFLQPDPIGEAGGINLYAYGLNDPVNLVDPDGLQAIQLPPVDVVQNPPPVPSGGVGGIGIPPSQIAQQTVNSAIGSALRGGTQYLNQMGRGIGDNGGPPLNEGASILGFLRRSPIALIAPLLMSGPINDDVISQLGLGDLKAFRNELGLAVGDGTLARLDAGGKSFYGINAHRQGVNLSVNAISRTHAETDAFQQAFGAGVRGGDAALFVDRPLCLACGVNGGVASMSRQLGFSSVKVYTPNGLQIIRP
ncbi:MAG: RHS repeat-associated core domain-containing protein [Hyphomicrobium sp.]|jgi:RHS repeat-associated protein